LSKQLTGAVWVVVVFADDTTAPAWVWIDVLYGITWHSCDFTSFCWVCDELLTKFDVV
jgi:hypothetical protein